MYTTVNHSDSFTTSCLFGEEMGGCSSSLVGGVQSPSYEEVLASTISFGSSLFIFVFCIFIFRIYQNNYERTRNRVFAYVFIRFLAHIMVVMTWILPLVIGFPNTPCWLTPLSALGIGFAGTANMLRNSYFVVMTALNVAIRTNGRTSYESIAEEMGRWDSLSRIGLFTERVKLSWFAIKFIFTPGAVVNPCSGEKQLRLLVTVRHMTTSPGLWFIAIPFFIPYVLMSLLVLFLTPSYSCYGCAPDTVLNAVRIVLYV